MAKTVASYEGMRVTLLDGTKDRIEKVLKTTYKTKGGQSIKATHIAKKGRGLIETDGDGVTAKKSTRRSASKSTAAKTSKKSAPAKKSSAKKGSGSVKDPADMTRRELVTELVDKEVLATRSAAKGTGVDDLRDMVEDARGGKKSSGKKSSGKKASAKSSKKSEGKVSRRRSRSAAEDAPKAKAKSKTRKVTEITDKIAQSVENAIEANAETFLKSVTGYDFTVACVGGIFNDKRLTVQIGLLPSDASREDIDAYAAEMQEDENAVAGELDDSGESDVDSVDENFEKLEELIGEFATENEDRIRGYLVSFDTVYDEIIEPKLGDEVFPGTRLDYDGAEILVIGYSESKGKMVVFDLEEEKLKLVSIIKIARMEILEDEGEEELLDEEPLDGMDDEEEEDFDDEEDDEEEDDDGEEEEDFDDEEDDEDGEEEEDEGDDDDFDDFDEEL